MLEPLLILGEFFYGLTHHPWAAILMGVAVVASRRRGWLLRLFIAVVLVALIHDAITGQLTSYLK